MTETATKRVRVLPVPNEATNARTIVSSETAAASTRGRDEPIKMIPKDQQYFWTRAWQEAEAEASGDIASGRVVSFDDPNDALRWLLRAED